MMSTSTRLRRLNDIGPRVGDPRIGLRMIDQLLGTVESRETARNPVFRWIVPVYGGYSTVYTAENARARAAEADAFGFYVEQLLDYSRGQTIHPGHEASA